jgi:hypothetical protein
MRDLKGELKKIFGEPKRPESEPAKITRLQDGTEVKTGDTIRIFFKGPKTPGIPSYLEAKISDIEVKDNFPVLITDQIIEGETFRISPLSDSVEIQKV